MPRGRLREATGTSEDLEGQVAVPRPSRTVRTGQCSLNGILFAIVVAANSPSVSRRRIAAFLRGFGSVLELCPTSTPGPILERGAGPEADHGALTRDWARVAHDLSRAVDRWERTEHGQKEEDRRPRSH